MQRDTCRKPIRWDTSQFFGNFTSAVLLCRMSHSSNRTAPNKIHLTNPCAVCRVDNSSQERAWWKRLRTVSMTGVWGLPGAKASTSPTLKTLWGLCSWTHRVKRLTWMTALKDIGTGLNADNSASYPGEGSSVNNDAISESLGNSARKGVCEINQAAKFAESCESDAWVNATTWSAASFQHLAAADPKDSSSASNGMAVGENGQDPVQQLDAQVTSGIPRYWGSNSLEVPNLGTGLGPFRASYQPHPAPAHPYPHPFSAQPRQVPVVQGTPQSTDKQPVKTGKRKTVDVDWTKIEDPIERRRQRRLVKNRNTAAISRERKKAQLQSLEDRVKALEEQNAALKYWLAYR